MRGKKLELAASKNEYLCEVAREQCRQISDEFVVERSVQERRQQLVEILREAKEIVKGVGADDGATSSDARSGDEHQRPAEGPRSEHVACKASEHQTSAATETLMIQGPNDTDEGDDSAGSIAGTKGYLMFSRDLGWEAWQLCVFESIVVDQRTREGRLLHAFVSQHLSIFYLMAAELGLRVARLPPARM